MHFDDSVESIADSDLEDGELQKMLTSPLYAQKASGKPDAMVVQDKEVSAQNTQTDRKESLRSQSSEGQKALGKPSAFFSSEQGNMIRSSVSRITCSIRQDQTWRSKNFMWSPSISASVNCNDKRKSKNWQYRTYSTDVLNLEENKYDYKKNCLWKKTFSEVLKSETCTKWEKIRERKNIE